MDTNLFVKLSAFGAALSKGSFFLAKFKRKLGQPGSKNVKLSNRELQILEGFKKKYTPFENDVRLPSFKREGFVLEDIARSATEKILSDPIPDEEAKAVINQGTWVKLRFINSDNETERLWVEIISFHKGLFQGELKSTSTTNENLKYGKDVWFHANHIFEIGKYPS